MMVPRNLSGFCPADSPGVHPLFMRISLGKTQQNQGLFAKEGYRNSLGSCRSTTQLRPQLLEEIRLFYLLRSIRSRPPAPFRSLLPCAPRTTLHAAFAPFRT